MNTEVIPNVEQFISLRNDMTKIIKIINSAFQNYNGVKNALKRGTITIPKGYIKNEKEVTFKIIVKNVFEISDSYARKLRWLGKLAHKYPKLVNLCITLNEMYKYKKNVDVLFNNIKYKRYQNLYKIEAEPMNMSTSESDDQFQRM